MTMFLYKEVDANKLGVRGEIVTNVNYCTEFYTEGDYYAIYERKAVAPKGRCSLIDGTHCFIGDESCMYAVYLKKSRRLMCLIDDAEIALCLNDDGFEGLRAEMYRNMAIAAGWPETLPYGIGDLSESNSTLESFVSICTQLGIPWEIAAYDGEGEVVYRANSDGAYLDTLLRHHAQKHPEITFAYMNNGVAVGHIDY